MSNFARMKRKWLFPVGAVFVFALLWPRMPAVAGYYNADTNADTNTGTGTGTGTSSATSAAGGLHTVVVMSVDKCYAALGKKQELYIQMHYADPYTECMRRLRVKQALEKKKEAAAKKTEKKKAEEEKTVKKKSGLEKDSGGVEKIINANGGGYYRVQQMPQKKTEQVK